MRPLAVLGATGYTGGLVLEQARAVRLPLRLVGRRRDALEAAAHDGDEVRVADARDRDGLRAAFDGAFAVVSCAGPFAAVGASPAAAAVDVGAHYLDTSAEQEFTRGVYDGFGGAARARGVTLLPSFGFDYVPGDLAARLAAEELEPLESVVVAYATSRVATSAGTRSTLAHMLRQRQVAWEGRALVPSRFGATVRRMRFPDGEATVVEWQGTEPLTVPRHTNVASVRSYLRVPRAAARIAPLVRPFAGVVELAGRVGRGPSEARRRRATFAVVAEARGARGGRRVTLTGSDVYGLTAMLLVRGVQALHDGEARTAGVAAPAEALEARALVERCAPLLRVAAVEAL